MKTTLTSTSIKATVLRFVLLAIFSVTMTGCATTAVTAISQQEASARATQRATAMREVKFNQSWRGRSLDELMKEFGEPMVFLKPIDPFLVNTTVAVFDATKTGSSCYDTFTVVARNGKWHVQEYVCT